MNFSPALLILAILIFMEFYSQREVKYKRNIIRVFEQLQDRTSELYCHDLEQFLQQDPRAIAATPVPCLSPGWDYGSGSYKSPYLICELYRASSSQLVLAKEWKCEN